MATTDLGLRERKKQATRTAIADAAARLFGERGFETVTVDEVAEHAGVSRQTVFNHFPNKEDLVLDRGPEVADAAHALVEAHGSGPQLVEAFRLQLHDFWGRFGELSADRPQQGFFAIVSASPALQAYARQLGAQMRLDLGEHVRARCELPPGDLRPGLLADSLLSVQERVFEQVRAAVLAKRTPKDLVAAVLAEADVAYALIAAGVGREPLAP